MTENELFIIIEDAYAVLGAPTNQWRGRHTVEGQRLLSNMRDAIADITGRDPQDVQDDYCNRHMGVVSNDRNNRRWECLRS